MKKRHIRLQCLIVGWHRWCFITSSTDTRCLIIMWPVSPLFNTPTPTTLPQVSTSLSSFTSSLAGREESTVSFQSMQQRCWLFSLCFFFNGGPDRSMHCKHIIRKHVHQLDNTHAAFRKRTVNTEMCCKEQRRIENGHACWCMLYHSRCNLHDETLTEDKTFDCRNQKPIGIPEQTQYVCWIRL